MLNTRIKHQEEGIKKIGVHEEIEDEEEKDSHEQETKFASQKVAETQTTFYIRGSAKNREDFQPNYLDREVINIFEVSNQEIAVHYKIKETQKHGIDILKHNCEHATSSIVPEGQDEITCFCASNEFYIVGNSAKKLLIYK